MKYVLIMSTDADIIDTPLNEAWDPITGRYQWNQVQNMNLQLPNGATIIVIAHGNGAEIGNEDPGTIDINATTFLALIQGNMAANAVPGAIYISTCATNIAEFAAGVKLAAEQNKIWKHTKIFGHYDPAIGPVPPPGTLAWVQIF